MPVEDSTYKDGRLSSNIPFRKNISRLVCLLRPQPARIDADGGVTSWMRRHLSLRSSKNTKMKTPPHAMVNIVMPESQCGETVTLALPPEILLAIFHYLDRDTRHLIRAGSVCARWRAIATQTPYFWTKITINFEHYYPTGPASMRFVLGILLERTGDLPLDVEIYLVKYSLPCVEPNVLSRVHGVFREKGPFYRWRSLILDVGPRWSAELPKVKFHDGDRLSGLEHLIVAREAPSPYLTLLNKTLTSKLRTLEIWNDQRLLPSQFQAAYQPILETIKIMHIGPHRLPVTITFPPNISTLHAGTVSYFRMPHIKYLSVGGLDLYALALSKPVNLVTLSIDVYTYGQPPAVRIDLPSLLRLKLRKETFTVLPSLNTPKLQRLSIESGTYRGPKTGPERLLAALKAMQVDELKILSLDARLDHEATIEILLLFPHLSQLDLHYHNKEAAARILSHIVAEASHSTYPSMDVMRIILYCPPRNAVMWKEYLSEETGKLRGCLRSLESSWPGGSCLTTT